MTSSRKYESYYSKYDNEVVDSRWAEPEEIKSVLTQADFSSDTLPASGVPFMSDGRTAYISTDDTHDIIIGATGSKKTRNVAFPATLMHIKAGESVIALDFKGEIFDLTSGIAKEAGYDVYVLNFRDPSLSNRWNPFDEPWRLLHEEHNIDASREMINDFIHNFIASEKAVNDPYWIEMAAALALGLCDVLMTCADREEASVKSLVYLRSAGLDMNGQGFLISLTNALPRDSHAYINLNSVFTTPDRTRTCIISTFDSCLRLFSAQPSLTEMFSGSDFDIRQFGERKSILYVIIPDEKTTYAKLVTTFIQQSYQALIRYATSQPDRRLRVRVNYLMEEFAQMPMIKDFCASISAARSRNIRYSIFIQSLHQLTANYGENAETILANTGNMIFLTSRELPLLERLSTLCGHSVNGQLLISPSRLQRLDNKKKGEALILLGSCYPYITHLADISEYEFEKVPPMSYPSTGAKAPLFVLESHNNRIEWLHDPEKMIQHDIAAAQEAKCRDELDESDNNADILPCCNDDSSKFDDNALSAAADTLCIRLFGENSEMPDSLQFSINRRSSDIILTDLLCIPKLRERIKLYSSNEDKPKQLMEQIDVFELTLQIEYLYRCYRLANLERALADTPSDSSGSRIASIRFGSRRKQLKSLSMICQMLSKLDSSSIAATEECSDLYCDITRMANESAFSSSSNTALTEYKFWHTFFRFYDSYRK